MKQLPPKDEGVIIAWIDKYQRDIPKLQRSLEENERLACQLRGTKEAFRIPDIRYWNTKIEKRIDWRRGRLRKLAELLAEVQTLSLPHMEGTNAPTNVVANPF